MVVVVVSEGKSERGCRVLRKMVARQASVVVMSWVNVVRVSSPRVMLMVLKEKVNESFGGLLVRKECPLATSQEACTRCKRRRAVWWMGRC